MTWLLITHAVYAVPGLPHHLVNAATLIASLLGEYNYLAAALLSECSDFATSQLSDCSDQAASLLRCSEFAASIISATALIDCPVTRGHGRCLAPPSLSKCSSAGLWLL